MQNPKMTVETCVVTREHESLNVEARNILIVFLLEVWATEGGVKVGLENCHV